MLEGSSASAAPSNMACLQSRQQGRRETASLSCMITANVLSGLHDLSTCLAFLNAPLSTRRLRRSPLGCGHSPPLLFLAILTAPPCLPSLPTDSVRPSPLLTRSRLRLSANPYRGTGLDPRVPRQSAKEGPSEDGSAAGPLVISVRPSNTALSWKPKPNLPCKACQLQLFVGPPFESGTSSSLTPSPC